MDSVTQQINDGNVPQAAVDVLLRSSCSGPAGQELDLMYALLSEMVFERRHVDKSSVSQQSLGQPTLLTNRPPETRNNLKSFPSALNLFISSLLLLWFVCFVFFVLEPFSLSRDRRSAPRAASAQSRAEDNPYDYRHLLRKTSQRRKLIKHY